MPSPNADRVQEIFAEALQQPTTDRAAYLAQACGDDIALRTQVESLLGALEEAGEFMKEPTGGGGAPDIDATLAQVPSERAGDVIGRYKLLQQIGEGGFGVVYMAEQEKPVRRKVALKIIKLGMDTKQVIARFEAERQALAMMDHSNIAKVLDAGATDTGRPYFVMELVRGEAITEYCDKNNLSVEDRLDLFQMTCNAVQHAHQKGIIHRDIKPNNVMITLHDGRPIPKVIDFGIAKATNQRLTEKTIFTEFRQFIGTPEYMSPEQAEMSGIDIDTRSDVYSLGVLLYELLTGTTPFASTDLRSAAFGEIQRIIREEAPHKPSTRLSTLDTLPSVAAQRRTEPKKLGILIRGDLDWIVMKALEKDRTRRYETANGFAADIQRFLNDEPVTAGPPSARYKLRKFIKRNKAGVTAASLIAAILVLGIAGTTYGMIRSIRAEHNARQAAAAEAAAKNVAQENERNAIAEAERAERELARATEIKRLITEMLQSVSPEEAQGADIALLKGILDDASERLKAGEITDDLIAAELHAVVGDVYWRLGLYPQAEHHLPVAVEIRKRVLGEEHPDTLRVMNDLALLYWNQGRYAEAEPLLVETLEIQKRVLGEEHPDTLKLMNNLANLYRDQGRYAETEPLNLQTLEIQKRVLGEEHPDTLRSMNNLAILYRDQGRYAEAEPLYVETVEIKTRVLGEEHPSTLGSMNNLAGLYWNQGRYAEAGPLHLQALEIKKRVLGDEHPSTLSSMGSLANLYKDQGLYAEAEPLYVETLEIRQRVLGEEHPSTLASMNNLAILYWIQGRYAEAEPLYVETLEIRKRVQGEEHPRTLSSMGNLAILYQDQGRYAEAEPLQVETLEIRQRVLGEEHPDTLASMHNLASLYQDQGRYAEAEPLQVETLEIRKRVLGAEHPSTLDSMNNLGSLYLSQGRYAEAEPLFVETLEIQQRVLGDEHPDTLNSMNNLADAYAAQGRFNEAEALLVQVLEERRRLLGESHPDVAYVMNSLARVYLGSGREQEAAAIASEACGDEARAGGSLATYLDTLALAQHMTGDTTAAITTQKRAIELNPDDEEFKATLAKYEASRADESGATDDDQP